MAKPKVMGSACWPCVLPIWSVCFSRNDNPINVRSNPMSFGTNTLWEKSLNRAASAVQMMSWLVVVKCTYGLAFPDTLLLMAFARARMLCLMRSSSR